MNFSSFEQLVFSRRAVRDFLPDVISDEILEKILRTTQQAPSGYNLQPVNFYIIKSHQYKEAIVSACLRQNAIISAPVILGLAADRNVHKHHFEKICDQDIQAGAITEEIREKFKLFVDMNFSHSPLGMGWVAKAFFAPFLKLFSPMPELPAVHKKAWLYLHIGLSAMNCMLAAQSAGLSTCPIGSFDARRVKRALKIPRSFELPLLLALGYSKEQPKARTRLPLESVIHWR